LPLDEVDKGGGLPPSISSACEVSPATGTLLSPFISKSLSRRSAMPMPPPSATVSASFSAIIDFHMSPATPWP
jgi:hypothetical protein